MKIVNIGELEQIQHLMRTEIENMLLQLFAGEMYYSLNKAGSAEMIQQLNHGRGKNESTTSLPLKQQNQSTGMSD